MYVWVTAFHNSPCEPCHLLRAPSMPWRYGEPVEGWWACTKAPTFSSWMAEQRPTIAIALCVAVKEGSHLYLWSVSWGSFSGFRGLGVGLVSRIFEHVMIWIFRRFTWIGTMKSIFHRFYGPIHFWSSTPSNIACFGNIWSIFKTNLSKGVIFIGSALKVWVFVLSKSRNFVRISTMLWSLLSNYLIQSKSKNVDWIFRFRVGILFDKHQVRFAHLTSVAPFQVRIGVQIWLWNWRHGSPKIYLCWLCPKKVLVVHAFWSPCYLIGFEFMQSYQRNLSRAFLSKFLMSSWH